MECSIKYTTIYVVLLTYYSNSYWQAIATLEAHIDLGSISRTVVYGHLMIIANIIANIWKFTRTVAIVLVRLHLHNLWTERNSISDFLPDASYAYGVLDIVPSMIIRYTGNTETD